MFTFSELINIFLKRFKDLVSEDITYFECKRGFGTTEYIFKITADNNEFVCYLYNYLFEIDDNNDNEALIETSFKMYVPYKNKDKYSFYTGEWYWIKDNKESKEGYIYDKINKTLIMN